MKHEPCEIPDVVLLEPKRFGDERGFFSETWSRRVFEELGLPTDWVQDNQSRSETVGTLRGLHFQHGSNAQAKLVRVTRGAIFDVAVDIRTESPTFGRWVGRTLSAENWQQLLIPAGFAHGFVTTEPGTEVCYKCSALYDPEHESGIRFDDPDLGIDWPLPPQGPVLSAKDDALGSFRDLPAYF